MRKMRPLLAAILAVLLSPSAVADDLLSIYQEALVSDPVFQQAIARRNAAEEALPQARAGLLPDIRASAEISRVRQDQDTRFASGTSTFNDETYALRLTQPVFRYSRFRQLDVADATVAQALAEFSAAEQDLMSRVAERYFAVLDAQVALQAAEAERKAIARQLRQAQERFQVGLIPRTNVEEAKARLDLATATALQAENELQNTRERLRELTGDEPDRLERVREGINLTRPEPSDVTAWRQRAAEQNWELAAAQKAAEAAMANIGVARGGHYPTVDLVGGYSSSDTGGPLGGDTDRASIGLQAELPLFTGGATSSRVREAQFRYTEARESLEETRRDVLRRAADAYRGVETALLRVQALDQARQSTRAALDATEAGFEVGTRTIVDVLDAQQELFRAERDYQQARHAYLLNTLRLQQAAGILSQEDLAAINTLLTQADRSLMPTTEESQDEPQ